MTNALRITLLPYVVQQDFAVEHSVSLLKIVDHNRSTQTRSGFSREFNMNHAGIALSGALVCFASFAAAASSSHVEQITALQVEYFQNPMGIDSPQPRMAWQMLSRARGAAQSAYEIRVATSEQALTAGRDLIWDSGKVISDQSTQHAYSGPPLLSRAKYFWQVRVWDEEGQAAGWSPIGSFEMGLLSSADWSGAWIAPAQAPTRQPSMLRREFRLSGSVANARIYVTSHGLYELSLNGKRVGDAVLAPGWTSYSHRVQYQTYDVTNQLHAGANALGAYLGDGWYRGIIGFQGLDEHYGKQVALLLQLEVTYQDGRHESINSDGTWKSAQGPILSAGIYEGETYDARLEKTGWDSPGFDDKNWASVREIDGDKDVLIAPQGPPVRRVEEVVAKRIFKTPAGDTVVDLGQNMVGWVRLKVQGPAGTTVTLRHAEVLDRSGDFYTENLRTAAQTVQYTLKGSGTEVYEPHFTFQGFRYVAVSGYPGKLTPASITGIVVHSDMQPTGEFASDKTLINQLQHNILWGQKGNFLDVPTDCPQRDERLGWTGDAQVFSPTAAFNMDVAGFFTKWLKDVAADQLASGSVPFVVPDVLSTEDKPAAGAAGWGDAATVIPWNVYLAYGDRRILEAQYSSMQRWVDYEQARAGADEIWDGDFHFGDWLDFFGAEKNTSFGSTSTDLIATAYFARSTQILAQAALLLGKGKDAARYSESLTKIKAAFQQKFVNTDGTVGAGTQTAYVLALDFDLLPEELRAAAARKLAQDVEQRGHLTTGFLGTPRLLSVLSRFGYLKDAFLLLNRETFPSWLYPVKQGATTIWERWDGLKPDGSFENKDMNSFNHYAYGAVGDWMYGTLGGIEIDAAAPGYKHILISPHPGGGFHHVHASHITPYGRVSTEWSSKGQIFNLTVTVPVNATATVRLPGARVNDLTESGKSIATGPGISSFAQQGNEAVVQVGAGRYVFRYTPSASLE
jgi:alpha-L-rhamnosidase